MIGRLKGDISLISEEVACPVNGKLTPMEIIAAVLKSQEGENLGHVLLLRDLTEIKRLRVEMARSQRLAAIGSLAAGMAHEIRNPLSSIKGFATYFRERYGDHPEDVKTADIMIGEVDRLNRVVSQLLEFARPVEIHRKPVSLMRILQSALCVIEAQTSGRIEIHIDIPRNLPEVRIDPDRFHQVFLNLFLNALAAMPDKGVLAVTGALSDDGILSIEVSDTGTGIPGQDIERIFDPYFTSKSSGTGLGLTIVQKIIEAHGGTIRVTSHPGRGTTMTILLPSDNQITEEASVMTAGKVEEI
jgi:two-component system sensor histidine kinase HydH